MSFKRGGKTVSLGSRKATKHIVLRERNSAHQFPISDVGIPMYIVAMPYYGDSSMAAAANKLFWTF